MKIKEAEFLAQYENKRSENPIFLTPWQYDNQHIEADIREGRFTGRTTVYSHLKRLVGRNG